MYKDQSWFTFSSCSLERGLRLYLSFKCQRIEQRQIFVIILLVKFHILYM